MLKRKPVWVLLALLLLTLGALGGRPSRASANVTLVKLTATSLTGLPEVYVELETATELDVAGFYVQRSLTNQVGSYVRLSPFIAGEGDSVTGAVYGWLDEMTTVNTTYYYRLEELPIDVAKPSILHGPISVIAGVAPTPIPTPTLPPTNLIYLPFIVRETNFPPTLIRYNVEQSYDK